MVLSNDIVLRLVIVTDFFFIVIVFEAHGLLAQFRSLTVSARCNF